MKSRITVDFKGGDGKHIGFEPVIRVRLESSEDVRDNLLKTLFQSLGGTSSWLKVEWDNSLFVVGSEIQNIVITPVKPDELPDMIKTADSRVTHSNCN